ncbi:MAG: DUF5793 family protein [Halobacteriales archaeon]|nr:DUF5793 family protein [Halobacteriales archaeon]
MGPTHRLTGDDVLELTADPETYLRSRARRDGQTAEGGPCYRTRVVADDHELAAIEKETLLAYGPDREHLRQHSLIPENVER